VVAFSPLGGGLLTGKYRERNREKGRDDAWAGAGFQPENSVQRSAILDALIAVADEIGVTPGEVAIAWVASKGALPIIGPRTLLQLEANLAAAEVKLLPQQAALLDNVSAIPTIYPHTVINDPRIRDLITGGKDAQIDMPTETVA